MKVESLVSLYIQDKATIEEVGDNYRVVYLKQEMVNKERFDAALEAMSSPDLDAIEEQIRYLEEHLEQTKKIAEKAKGKSKSKGKGAKK